MADTDRACDDLRCTNPATPGSTYCIEHNGSGHFIRGWLDDHGVRWQLGAGVWEIPLPAGMYANVGPTPQGDWRWGVFDEVNDCIASGLMPGALTARDRCLDVADAYYPTALSSQIAAADV